jgi:hypothetical protein
MKSLAGAGAQPLRHLEFLIHHPKRSVMLLNGGVPVTIPRAERYAVHKVIVAVERRDQIKARKDITQAGTLSWRRPSGVRWSLAKLGLKHGTSGRGGAKSSMPAGYD